MSSLTTSEAGQAASARRKKRLTAFLFVAPLLLFILVTFVAPIGSMLWRSVYHPTVAELIPLTLAELERWDDHKQLPDEQTLQVFVSELHGLNEQRLSGKLSEEFNRAYTGMSSVVKATARRVGRLDAQALQSQGVQTLLDAHRNWSKPELWYAIERAGKVYTYDYYLTALDLEMHPDEGIQARQDTQIYLQLYSKTLNMALVITLLCALLGYPLAYYLASLPSNRANLLLVLVLLPFWTSLLVRTTSWIALLQTNGVINSTLMGIGLISQPFEMLYTSFATVVAMTHILLPFMILPLYSVMKTVPPNYLRAAVSLGSHPLAAFVRVVLPQTYPGIAAGSLLVFITSIGYYVTPALLGGASDQMLSYYIAQYTNVEVNWGMACALGAVLLSATLVLFVFYRRVSRGGLSLG